MKKGLNKLGYIKKFFNIVKKQGLWKAIQKLLGYSKFRYNQKIANIWPRKRLATLNNVKVPSSAALPHLKYGKILPFYCSGSEPDHSGGEINAHKNFTKKNDNVIVIGGGRGVSAVRASQICYPGKVLVYEPSLYYVRVIQEVCSLNKISNCNVIHGYVGPTRNLWEVFSYSNEKIGEKINLKDLPKCDVLEMDCEGAEYEIISNLHQLTWKPRLIIMEIHPHHANQTPEFILRKLKELNYEVIYRSTNKGRSITAKEFRQKLESLYYNKKTTKKLPPVIGATLQN